MFELNSNDNSKRAQEGKVDDFTKWTQSTRYLTEQKTADNVIRVLEFPEFSPSGKQEMIKQFDYTHNLVTNDGEIFYAKQGAGETPSANEDFLLDTLTCPLQHTQKPRQIPTTNMMFLVQDLSLVVSKHSHLDIQRPMIQEMQIIQVMVPM
jgi:hypothetical protein